MGLGGFNDPMRGEPELIFAVGNSPGWCVRLSHLVPGMGATDHLDLALLAHHGLPAASAGGFSACVRRLSSRIDAVS